MNTKNIAFVSIKVLAIYTFLQALLNIAKLINYVALHYISADFLHQLTNFTTFETQINLVSILPFILLLLISVILWKNADRLFSHIASENLVNNDNQHMITIHHLQTTAFAIVGLIIIASTIPEFFPIVPNLMKLYQLGNAHATFDLKFSTYFLIIEQIVKLIIGFSLFFGSNGLSGLLRRIRKAGMNSYS